MAKAEVVNTTELPLPELAAEPEVTKPSVCHAGSDMEAFYAAQKEAARASREYAARRRQR